MALIFILNSKMSLILAVTFYIWASLFVAGKHLMASSAKLRHRTKWKDPILLAVTVNQNKEQQYNSNNQQQKWNNINKKKHKQHQNKQLQNNWDFSQINKNNLPFMWWSLRTLKCVKCNFRCYGYRGCSQLFFPSPSWPWSVISTAYLSYSLSFSRFT